MAKKTEKTLLVILTKPIHKRLKEEAEIADLSMSNLVRISLKMLFDKMDAVRDHANVQ